MYKKNLIILFVLLIVFSFIAMRLLSPSQASASIKIFGITIPTSFKELKHVFVKDSSTIKLEEDNSESKENSYVMAFSFDESQLNGLVKDNLLNKNYLGYTLRKSSIEINGESVVINAELDNPKKVYAKLALTNEGKDILVQEIEVEDKNAFISSLSENALRNLINMSLVRRYMPAFHHAAIENNNLVVYIKNEKVNNYCNSVEEPTGPCQELKFDNNISASTCDYTRYGRSDYPKYQTLKLKTPVGTNYKSMLVALSSDNQKVFNLAKSTRYGENINELSWVLDNMPSSISSQIKNVFWFKLPNSDSWNSVELLCNKAHCNIATYCKNVISDSPSGYIEIQLK